MHALLLVLFFSVGIHAQEFTLLQAENQHYRSYTREELEARLGVESANLGHYKCNGVNEHDILWPALHQNEKGDSLKVQPDSGDLLTYMKGKFYRTNGKQVKLIGDSFVSEVKAALKRIEKFSEGAGLLRQLERSSLPLTIVRGTSAFSPHDNTGKPNRGIYQANAISIFTYGRMTSEDVPFDSIGAGGKIGWNPLTPGLPSQIALVHEMYHAFDSIRGILDMRFVKGETYEQVLMSEYRATYMENLGRKSAKIPYRKYYGEGSTGPGLLGADGLPRKMPSPCLN